MLRYGSEKEIKYETRRKISNIEISKREPLNTTQPKELIVNRKVQSKNLNSSRSEARFTRVHSSRQNQYKNSGNRADQSQDQQTLSRVRDNEIKLNKNLKTVNEAKQNNDRVLKSRIQELQHKIKHLVYSESSQKIINQNQNLKQENNRLKATIEILREQIKNNRGSKDSVYKQMTANKSELTIIIEDLNKQIQAMSSTLEQFRQENQILKMQNEQIMMQKGQVQQFNQSIKGIIKKYEQDIDQKAKQLNNVNQKYRILLFECKKYERKLRSNGKEVTENERKEIEELTFRKEQAASAIKIASSEWVAELIKQIERLNRSNQTLQRKIARLTSKKSQQNVESDNQEYNRQKNTKVSCRHKTFQVNSVKNYIALLSQKEMEKIQREENYYPQPADPVQ